MTWWWWRQARRRRLRALAAWEAQRRHGAMWHELWAAMHRAQVAADKARVSH